MALELLLRNRITRAIRQENVFGLFLELTDDMTREKWTVD